MHIKLYIAIFCLCYVSVYLAVGVNIDSSGYILYCPCMGRFGNQADHFLGALGFAKGLNRTLALPPWVEYRYGEAKSRQVPFDTYFQVEPLEEFHRVITMEAFMEGVAPTLWPPEKRISFCYMSRGKPEGCAAKEGNPFGPFWDTFSVDFTGSEFYAPLHYDVHHHDMGTMWNEKYNPEEWPVLAFTGAPASFPVQDENRGLHKHLVWSKEVEKRAKEFIKTVLPKGSFVGIHLRNGVDWVRACEHVKDATNFFSSPQCLGYRNEHGKPTKEMCFPSLGTITKLLKRVVKQIKAVAVFVASDNNYMITELETALKRMEVSVHKYEPANPHVELAILGQANHFIGNCISSFSAFAKRERDVRGFPSSFWDFPPEKLNKSKESKIVHDEF